MDEFKIDSHKLIYHVSRVNDWIEGKNIFPIYLEISTSGSCNHRCTYCALDFMGYQPRFLKTDILKKRLSEMARLGVKSIMYAGEGEPLLHKDIAEIINHTKSSGIDVGLTTNGVLLDKELIDRTLANVSWVKVSINGATKETYRKIHQSKAVDLDKVIKNMRYAVKSRIKNGHKCVLGMQLLLLPENSKEVKALAVLASGIGLDYLVVKPYSQHPFSKTTRYKNIKYDKYLKLADELKAFKTDKFNVIFRANTMKKWDHETRNYKHCYALPFWSYIDAGGNVWGCSVYLGKNEFLYGNIYKQDFKDILNSPKRSRIIKMAARKLCVKDCRVNCRMDEINRYLWELKHPSEHVNFI
ncbi:MAG: radical SAM protein [Candidatus Omnitrophica bacterium]|nr:radical SAM protein [Candidatus Omnitrophota bacterium]